MSDCEKMLNTGMWPAHDKWVQDKVGLVIDVPKFNMRNFSKSFRNNCILAAKRGITEAVKEELAEGVLLRWGKIWEKYYAMFRAEEYLKLAERLDWLGQSLYILLMDRVEVVGLTSMLVTEEGNMACFLQFFWDKESKELRKLSLGAYQLYLQIEACRVRGIKYLLLRGPQDYKFRFKPRIVNYNKGETIL